MSEKDFSRSKCSRRYSGGGLIGGLGFGKREINFDSVNNSLHFANSVNLIINGEINQQLDKQEGRIDELNKTSLGTWRYRSEGVGEDLLFIKGWQDAGPHKIVKSNSHSQGYRELFGGREISKSLRGFGPRKLSKEVENLQKAQNLTNKESYWDKLQKSSKYIEKQDLEGIDNYGKTRDKDLEEDIFGLYKGREGGISKFGTEKESGLLELQFKLTNFKDFLNSNEEELIKNGGKFGQIVDNQKIKQTRLLGDVEAVFFNYLRKVLGEKRDESKQLKEKNIGLIIKALLVGEQVGFNCSENNPMRDFFKECSNFRGDGSLKSVLKSTYYRNGAFRVPEKEIQTSGTWNDMRKVQDAKQAINRDDLKSSPLVDEQCEESDGGSTGSDPTLEIRRNICQQIVVPWFGDVVGDKRLCLIEIPEFQYYLRLNTYLNVFELPTGHNKNTFGTKCSNYYV